MKRREFFFFCGAAASLGVFASSAQAANWKAFCTKCDFKASGSGDKPSYKTGDKCPNVKCKDGTVIVSIS